MTLTLWKAPLVDGLDEAKALLDRWYDDHDQSAFEPSEDISRFAEELRQLYPDDPDTVFGDSDDSPWADMPFEQSDRLIDLSIRWSADNAAIDAIVELSRKYELVLYDPQGPDVHLPTDPIEREPIPPPRPIDHLTAVAIALFFAGLTYAAWHIPIGWLRWPAVAIAAFFTAAVLFVVYAGFAATGDEPS